MIRVALLLTFALALPVLVPAAHAQPFAPSLDLNVKTQALQPITPGGPAQSITVHWMYTFHETVSAVAAQSSKGTTLHWDPAASCDGRGLFVTGPKTTAIEFTGPGTLATQAQYSGDVTFGVAADATAGGETPWKCTFKAFADPVNAAIGGATATPVSTTVVVAWTGALQAMLGAAPMQTPQGLSYDVTVSNLGNSRAEIRFTADGGARASLPAPFILESAAQSGTTTTRMVQVILQAPAGGGPLTTVLHIVPASTMQAQMTGPATNLTLTAPAAPCGGGGCIVKASPDAGPLLTLGLVACALVARRRT